jgi:hypothetical protein
VPEEKVTELRELLEQKSLNLDEEEEANEAGEDDEE